MADRHTEDEAREEIAETEEAEARDRATGAASLFDLRLVIGGLLGLYGVVLTVMGLFASRPMPRPRPPASTSTCGRAWPCWWPPPPSWRGGR
jgi:hypothetical protein